MKRLKSLLLDSNAILRYLLKDNEEMYIKICAVLEDIRIGNRNAIILEGVIMECVYVLTKFYRVPRKETAMLLMNLLSYKGIRNQDRNELIKALEIFADKSIDIVDCILYAKARALDMDVYSFDTDIKKLFK